MPDLASAATGAAVSGGLGIISSGLNYLFNKRLAEQQNQYNIDMWKMQAEYNSPQAQMQRFSEAGLNPNLIYGQGSNGNMASAPQMVTPQAPEFSRAAQKLGEAFNIENLRTLIANRKKAQEEAEQAKLRTFDLEDQRIARINFGDLYSYDPKSGTFVFNSPDVSVSSTNPRGNKLPYRYTNSYYFGQYHMNSDRNRLIPYRAALLNSQYNYLAPQIQMSNYEAKYFPYSYWIGQGSRAIKGISDAVGILRPSNWLLPIQPGKGYFGPWSGHYYY